MPPNLFLFIFIITMKTCLYSPSSVPLLLGSDQTPRFTALKLLAKAPQAFSSANPPVSSQLSPQTRQQHLVWFGLLPSCFAFFTSLQETVCWFLSSITAHSSPVSFAGVSLSPLSTECSGLNPQTCLTSLPHSFDFSTFLTFTGLLIQFA